MCPPALALDRWAMERLGELKARVRDDADWDPRVPREWQLAMNLTYAPKRSIAVTSLAAQLPANADADVFHMSLTMGPDVITMIPLTRWDHAEYSDDDPEGWRWGKTFSIHGGFIDSKLFDHILFGLTAAEAMDVNLDQRHLLEVGYETLYGMGLRRRSLLNSVGNVAVGYNCEQLSFVRKPIGADGPSNEVGHAAASRLSFVFGLTGPAVHVDTDTCSGMTAMYVASQSLQRKENGDASSTLRGVALTSQPLHREGITDFGIALGCATMLTPRAWTQHRASVRISPHGRCFSLDASANGYVRAEACVGVGLQPCPPGVERLCIDDLSVRPLGLLIGCGLVASGGTAGGLALNGKLEREVIENTVLEAGLSAMDIDLAEAHSYGSVLEDAAEVHALERAHRREDPLGWPLMVTSVKTLTGHTMECGGLASFLKVVSGHEGGFMAPSIHLRAANPRLNPEALVAFPTICLDYWRRTNISGVLSKGFGGTGVYCVIWGAADGRKVTMEPGAGQPASPDHNQHLLPDDRGAKDVQDGPHVAYCIVGSWSEWQDPEPMQPERTNVFTAIVTLGDNGWEHFQIWVDADPSRALHPSELKAALTARVEDPEAGSGARRGSWLLGDDRHSPFALPAPPSASALAAASGEKPTRAVDNVADRRSRPGDVYLVSLCVASGCPRVNCVRVGEGAPVPRGTYYVAADWNDWDLEEMPPDPSGEPGLFSTVVTLSRPGGAFQIVRNRDWHQVFHPPEATRGCRYTVGPDDGGAHLNWLLAGAAGDVFRVEFLRLLEGFADTRRVTWRRLRRTTPSWAGWAPGPPA